VAVSPDGKKLARGEIFHKIEPGYCDGLRIDEDGNLWSSAADGVHCIDPHGKLLGKIRVPHTVSNVTFGGDKKNRLFIGGSPALYAIFLNRRGVQRRVGVARPRTLRPRPVHPTRHTPAGELRRWDSLLPGHRPCEARGGGVRTRRTRHRSPAAADRGSSRHSVAPNPRTQPIAPARRTLEGSLVTLVFE